MYKVKTSTINSREEKVYKTFGWAARYLHKELEEWRSLGYKVIGDEQWGNIFIILLETSKGRFTPVGSVLFND